MPSVLLTKDFIEALQPPAKGEKPIEYTDTKVGGLKLRIMPSGQCIWSIRYKPIGSAKKKRFPLGDFPSVSVADARKKAEAVRGKKTEGADPAAEREAIKTERKRKETEEVLTVDKAIELYTPDLKERKSSWDQDLGHLKRNVQGPWGSRPFNSITKSECASQIQQVKAGKGDRKAAPVSAIRLRAAMLTYFQWGVDSGLLESSPMVGISKPSREKRDGIDRTLSDAELVALWRAIDDAKLAQGLKAALQVLALTGQRPNEIAGLEIGDLHHLDNPDEAYAEIPAARMKGRKRHIWPISRPVATIIKAQIERQQEDAKAERRDMGEYIFASRYLGRERIARHSLSQALRRIIPALEAKGDDAAIVKSLKADAPTPHAFRRTCATGMARLRIPKEDRRAVLAHADDDVMAQHYDAYDRFAEKKIALDAWARHVEALLSGEKQTGATIVPMRARS